MSDSASTSIPATKTTPAAASASVSTASKTPSTAVPAVSTLPQWAQDMRDLFRSGSVSQFILHGNVFDLVPATLPVAGGTPTRKLLPLKSFLEESMFAQYDVVIHYDRGKGLRCPKGTDDFCDWLESLSDSDKQMVVRAREPAMALELIDRYLLRTLNIRTLSKETRAAAVAAGAKSAGAPERIAVILDFAEFIVPAGNALSLGGDFAANIVRILTWANDPAILQSNIITVLLTEELNDLNEEVINNPHPAKLKIPLPDDKEMAEYVNMLQQTTFPDLAKKCEVPLEVLGRRLTGLSRIGARTLIGNALNNDRTITAAWLTRMKKDAIERETNGLLEFIESNFTLDNLAGSDAIKAWLRQDAALLKKGAINSLPMGYLISGRIGTGKTFMVNCWAGELGVPCVVFKNFRDKWVGATESNLEKIFNILRALGQVVVFVDEADQMTGKRDSNDDSGLSGRVYAMLAKEMSDTRNRGKIIWVFATSRPDLVEVDLKRPGRLDVHIPLFPPQNSDEMKALFTSVAGKFKFPLKAEEIPDMPAGLQLAGNEIESLLVRVLRQYELADDSAGQAKPGLKGLLEGALKEVRPNPNTKKLEYMDLAAVKECTDNQFLPAVYREMGLEAIERRLAELRAWV
ncbi:MAG TPA: AAA family ATPase [Phycisphaerae bacterium]|nr:AAA family ATPase [Phycisphaerae bacterium]